MYSFATLISRILPENKIKDSLRRLYYNKIWFEKEYRNYTSLLRRHNLAFEVNLPEIGIKKIGFEDSSYIFYVDSNVPQVLLERIWLYNVLKYLSRQKRKEILPFAYISAHGYFLCIKEIFENYIYERIRVLEPGDVVFDIGANYGVFTIKAAKIVGEDGLVVAIEPDPVHVKYLEKNVELNDLKNVLIVKKAVWNSKGMLRFKRFLWGGANRIADLYSDDIGEFSSKPECIEETTVETDTIDNIVAELGLQRVDFIKMDIERAEVEAIKGAQNTLKKCSPHLAIAAYHKIPPTYERSYKILEPMLRSLGYKTITDRPLKENPEEVILYAWK